MSAGPYARALYGIGVRALASADLGSYQGDWIAVVRDDGSDGDFPTRFGFIAAGYGSCSGCDAWIAASNAVNRLEVLRELLTEGQGARWFDTLDEAKAYVAKADGDRFDWWAHETGWAGFVTAVAALNDYSAPQPYPTPEIL